MEGRLRSDLVGSMVGQSSSCSGPPSGGVTDRLRSGFSVQSMRDLRTGDWYLVVATGRLGSGFSCLEGGLGRCR